MPIRNNVGIQPELRQALVEAGLLDVITQANALNLPMDAEADLAGGADLAAVIAKINALLAKLRTAGLLDT